MNSIMKQFADLLQQNHAVRDELWGVIDDSALKHSLGGNSMTLGALFKEQGEVEHAYVQSFKTFKQDFSYRNTEAGLDSSVDKLRAWFKELDEELNAALSELSEEDIQGKMIDRGGWDLPIATNFHFYREGLLMFCAKASIYLKSLRITPPKQFSDWIG
jgi:hypothetical protein